MDLQTLPIGEQSFEKMRRENRLYVDKTEYVYRMAKKGTYYFLSRPRRFGKSLLLSTIEAYFLGQRELFKGLYVSTQEKDWFEHPVMHLDFSAQSYTSEEKLYNIINNFLLKQEAIFGSKPGEVDLGLRFEGVIQRAYEQTGRGVVILVDEYDKPLLHAIGKPEQQDAYREMLRGFYGALKSMNKYIRFAFLTGITKFSKISIFSDLNNLNDISRDRAYANICGLTDAEVDRDLTPHIRNFAAQNNIAYEEARKELQRMYDGYHFVADSEGLYNPFSIMCALSKGELGSYWFETGTPTMLVEMLQRKQYRLDALEESVNDTALDSKDGDGDSIVPLLFQSGYLSIKERKNGQYWLKFPNEEVQDGFFQFLLPYYTSVQKSRTRAAIQGFVDDIYAGRAEQFLQRLQSFFADYQYDTKMTPEAHFQNVMFILLKLLGLQVEEEHKTSDGRIDLLITTDKYRYVIECKIDSTPTVALKQIHDKEYGLSWTLDEKETIFIGLNFSTEKRRPDGWIIERQDGTISESGVKSGMKNGTKCGMDDKSVREIGQRNRSEKIGQRVAKRVEQVFALIKANPAMTRDELSEAMHMAPSSIQRYIDILKKSRIRRDGSDTKGTWIILEDK